MTTTEPLDPLYTPAFRVERRYEEYFRPTMITDARGALNEELQGDLLAAAYPEEGCAAARSVPNT